VRDSFEDGAARAARAAERGRFRDVDGRVEERRAADEAQSIFDRNGAQAGVLVRALRAFGRCLLAAPRAAGVLLALAWMAFNVWLSSGTRGPDEAAPIYAFVSNLAHAPLFGLLALWWLVALPRRAAPFRWADLSPLHVFAVWLAVVAWGVVDELYQSTVDGRDASFLDVVTDGVGAAALLVVVIEVGRSDASTRSVGLRLVLGVAACAAAALAATFF